MVPLHKPGLELYIPFNCFKRIVYKLRIKLQNQNVFSQKMHPFAFLGLLIGQNDRFPCPLTPTRGVDRAVLMFLYSSNISLMSNLPCMFTHSTVFHHKNLSLKLEKAITARHSVRACFSKDPETFRARRQILKSGNRWLAF